MVWVNALIESAGTEILSGPEEVDLEQGPTEKALEVMGRLANSSARAAEPLDLRRGQRPARLRGGRIGLHDQLHLRLRERPGRSAGDRQEDGLRALPAGRRRTARASRRSAASTSRSAPSPRTRTWPSKPPPAWPTTKSQLTAVELDGLPPSRSDLYADKVVTEAYPGLRRAGQGIDRGRGAAADAPPPTRTSRLAVQRSLHPPDKIDPEDTESIYDELKSNLEDAVKREGLL